MKIIYGAPAGLLYSITRYARNSVRSHELNTFMFVKQIPAYNEDNIWRPGRDLNPGRGLDRAT